jgi:hypothetical protein
MNVGNRRSARRRGRAILRMVLGLGTAVAAAAGCLLSGAPRIEALMLPGLVLALSVSAVALYGRARTRREWSAAWDAYTENEGTRNAVHPTPAS